jgi:hypothetical protein
MAGARQAEVVTLVDKDGNETPVLKVGGTVRTKAQVEASLAAIEKQAQAVADHKAKVVAEDPGTIQAIVGRHLARLDRAAARLQAARTSLADALANMG